MIAIFYLVLQILKLYSYVVIANVIISWLIAFNILNTQNRFVYVILDFPFIGPGIIPKINALIALSGSILTGLSYVLVRKASQLKESPYVIMFYFPLFTVPLSLFILPGNWVNPSEVTWGYLLMVGISSQLGQLFLTFGYELLPASRAAMTSYLQVPFSVIAGIIIFHDVITFNFMIGTLMILFTILIIIIKENTNSQAI